MQTTSPVLQILLGTRASTSLVASLAIARVRTGTVHVLLHGGKIQANYALSNMLVPGAAISWRGASLTNRARLTFLASAAGIGAYSLDAIARAQPDLLTIGALSLGWGALATTGVVCPSLQIYGRVICHGDPGNDRVALTFDDGPHPVTTRRVLAALARTRHRATFFVLGEKVRRQPEVVREIHAAGHTLAVHGDSHDRFHSFRTTSTVRDGINRARDAVSAATGARPRFFRPPLGHTSLTTVRGARQAGVTLVGWSSRGYDGVRRCSPDAVVERVARTLCGGAIVLLHDAAEHDDFEPAGVPALPRLLALLDERRLTSVGLDTLLA